MFIKICHYVKIRTSYFTVKLTNTSVCETFAQIRHYVKRTKQHFHCEMTYTSRKYVTMKQQILQNADITIWACAISFFDKYVIMYGDMLWFCRYVIINLINISLIKQLSGLISGEFIDQYIRYVCKISQKVRNGAYVRLKTVPLFSFLNSFVKTHKS